MRSPRSYKYWLRGVLPDFLAALLIGGLGIIALAIMKGF
jgi:ABC-type multidrug transport system permease subunit